MTGFVSVADRAASTNCFPHHPPRPNLAGIGHGVAARAGGGDGSCANVLERLDGRRRWEELNARIAQDGPASIGAPYVDAVLGEGEHMDACRRNSDHPRGLQPGGALGYGLETFMIAMSHKDTRATVLVCAYI
jgi:hypothetical protein